MSSALTLMKPQRVDERTLKSGLISIEAIPIMSFRVLLEKKKTQKNREILELSYLK